MRENPTYFDAVVGQERAKATLGSMLESGRIPHALLFAGPYGVGKGETAIDLARMLLCANGPASGCSSCGPCRRAAKLEHPDLHMLFPTRARPAQKAEEDKWIDELNAHRELIAGERYAPLVYEKNAQIVVGVVDEVRERLLESSLEGGRRVCVVLSAERLNPATGNRLLKVLEEPPPGVHFILTAERVSSVLATIVSRSTVIRFRRLTAEEVGGWLSGTVGIDPELRKAAALESEGSIKTAKKFVFEGAFDLRARAYGMYDHVADKGPDAVVSEASQFLWSREVVEAEEILQGFARRTRAVMGCFAGCGGGNEGFSEDVRSLAERTDTAGLDRLGRGIERGLEALSRNANISLVMTRVFYAINDAYR